MNKALCMIIILSLLIIGCEPTPKRIQKPVEEIGEFVGVVKDFAIVDPDWMSCSRLIIILEDDRKLTIQDCDALDLVATGKKVYKYSDAYEIEGKQI